MAIFTKQHQRADSQVRRFFRRLSLQKCDSEKSTFSVHRRSCIIQKTTVLQRCNSTPEPTPVPAPRRVHFCEDVEVHKAKHVCHDNSKRWYSVQELEAFQTQAKAILQADANIKRALRTNLLQGAYELYAAGLTDFDHRMVTVHGENASDVIGLTHLASSVVSTQCHQRLGRRLRDLNSLDDKDQRARMQSQASLCASQLSRLTAAQLGHWWATHCRNN
mmetsp:Transcript_16313/g.32827  ORF Transcript_16313/g.32827 Transcript_16313/m.32827 type:complete len:219 (-) Transcript_16313:215-871(-)